MCVRECARELDFIRKQHLSSIYAHCTHIDISFLWFSLTFSDNSLPLAIQQRIYIPLHAYRPMPLCYHSRKMLKRYIFRSNFEYLMNGVEKKRERENTSRCKKSNSPTNINELNTEVRHMKWMMIRIHIRFTGHHLLHHYYHI